MILTYKGHVVLDCVVPPFAWTQHKRADQRIYERTTDLRRMLAHAVLHEAIRDDWDAIRGFMPAVTATYISYQKGVPEAVVWNEGGARTTIPFPVESGWYIPDGNPFAIPNGARSDRRNPHALFLDIEIALALTPFCGRLVRGNGPFFDGRGVYLDIAHSSNGVAIGISGLSNFLTSLPKHELAKVDPIALLTEAERLEQTAFTFAYRSDALKAEHSYLFIEGPLENARLLRAAVAQIQAARAQ